MSELVVVFIGVLGLEMLFAAVRSEWPHSYFQAGNGFQRRLSAHPLSYCLFRFGPVFIVCLFAAAVLAKGGHPFWWAIGGIVSVHVFYRVGRATLGAIREAWPVVPWIPLIAYLGIAAGCLVTAFAAGLLAHRAAPYVPTGGDLVVAAWTGVFAAIGGAWLIAATRRGSDGTEAQQRAFEASRKALGNDLWDQAARSAMDVHADVRLVHAVMLVENLQRPRWLRHAERLVGRLPRSGSFGPLQVQGVPPTLDDVEALDAAIRLRFRGQKRIDPYGNLDYAWLDLFLAAYNPNKAWQQDVRDAYSWLENRSSAATVATEYRAEDGLPILEADQLGDGASVELSGSLGPGLCFLVLEQLGDDGRALESEVVHTGLVKRRQSWSLSVERLMDTCTLLLSAGFVDGRGLDKQELQEVEGFGVFLAAELQTAVGGAGSEAVMEDPSDSAFEGLIAPDAFREVTLALPCLPLSPDVAPSASV